MKLNGAVACGHAETSAAAVEVLRAGGTAFDAVIAAAFTACVAEPLLCSLGGGGFLLAREAGKTPRLIDFFTQTPAAAFAGTVNFYPILGDFGTQTQEFHIGLGAMAVPGCVRGLLHIHQQFGRLPLSELVMPAARLARQGVKLNEMQAFTLKILQPIIDAEPESRAVFMAGAQPRGVGERLYMPDLAGFLETLPHEGDALFYRGEVAGTIADDCAERGGHLTRADLAGYEVIERDPINWTFAGARLWTNPPPSSGGLLIAYATRLFEAAAGSSGSDQLQYVQHLLMAQRQANLLRGSGELPPDELLSDSNIAEVLRRNPEPGFSVSRGTTHISIIDADANAASMTLSNGEGCGYMPANTGIMMNNMLGEEDLNPQGLGLWPPDQRLRSMMSPTIAERTDGRMLVLGTGGSNRIRSTILQALVRRLYLGQDLAESVQGARLHLERTLLNIEDFGWEDKTRSWMISQYPEYHLWPEPSLFFGGVHAVEFEPGFGQLSGIGDSRRDGHFETL